jgi:hypothetical protein
MRGPAVVVTRIGPDMDNHREGLLHIKSVWCDATGGGRFGVIGDVGKSVGVASDTPPQDVAAAAGK